MSSLDVVVIIAAYNAERTIGDAVTSALSEARVAEVVVVDDASTDRTPDAARRAGDGDPRLKVVIQDRNQGPSAARNRAIADSVSPYIAILDADDIVLRGRFDRIFADTEWDFSADNIIMCGDFQELQDTHGMAWSGGSTAGRAMMVDLRGFVLGNVSDPTRMRGELGFLKPVMSRKFLQEHGLDYDETCWLGEDFLLYASALANGARFRVIGDCGYAALVRRDSLSGGHSLEDLLRLHDRSREIASLPALTASERAAMDAHVKSLKRRIDHRHVLAVRQSKGLLKGIWAAAGRPTTIADILRDRRRKGRPVVATPRRLLGPEAFHTVSWHGSA